MTKLKIRTGGTWRVLSGDVPTITRPDAPALLGVTAGDSQIIVAWLAPEAGGSPITLYTVTVTPGGATYTTDGATFTRTITGLTNGTPYTVQVRATNAVAAGPNSSSSAEVTPNVLIIRRTAANTGPLGVFDSGLGRNLLYTDLTAYAGSLTITVDGTTLYRQDVTGNLVIKAHNVTVDQCRVRGTQYSGNYTVNWSAMAGGVVPTGFLIRDSEIDGRGIEGRTPVAPYPTGWAHSAAVEPSWGYTMTRCNVHGTTDGIKPQTTTGTILVEDSYIHDLIRYYTSATAATHNDITQIATGSAANATIRRCNLDGYISAGPYYVNGAGCQFGSFQAGKTLASLLFEDNYVDGSNGYGFQLSGLSGLTACTDVIIRRNRFGLHFIYGARSSIGVALDAGTALWEDNVWDIAGTTDGGTAVLAGQLIP